MKKLLLLLAVGFGVWQVYHHQSSVSLGDGVMARTEPQQGRALSSGQPQHFPGYSIKKLRSFHIKAKILSKHNYHLDRESDLSPTDLALGWGRMSDEAILKKIDISQSGRFYYWHVDRFPIPRREIETHSANMHLIPANDAVKDAIERARQGEIIELSGSLVEVTSRKDGWHWKSSLTREDTGAGACELVLVDSFRIVSY